MPLLASLAITITLPCAFALPGASPLAPPRGDARLAAPAAPHGDDTDEVSAEVEKAKALLVEGSPKERVDAIELLAALGGPEATRLVLGALSDADPVVADTAQALLPDVESPELILTLQGRDGLKSKNALVRRRVAEALGRFQGPIEAQFLLRAIKTRDVRLSRLLLWSLERLAERGALSGKPQRTIKAVRMLTGRGDNDPIRAAAMQVLSQLDPHDGAISLDNLRVGCGLETASCLMDTFQRLKPTGYVGAIVRGLSHPNAGVRMRAVDVLLRSGVTRHTLTAMIQQLEDEPRAGVRRRLVGALRYFTGEPLGDEAGPWKEFANGLKPGWTTGETKSAIRERARAFGKIDILQKLTPTSDRVAVMVDVSSSFWAAQEDGSSRAETILPEVSALLRRLDQTGTFYLVPFAGEPAPWSEKPVPATPANIERACEYLAGGLAEETAKDQGCNIYAALSKVLEFQELDSIVVITGSSDYVGDHGSSSLMVKLFEERSRFRPAIFDFVLLGAVGPNASRWTQLAASRGGRVYRVNFH